MNGLVTMSSTVALLFQEPPSIFRPRGAGAQALADLGMLLSIAGGVVFVVVTLLIVIGALRRRGTLVEHAPPDQGGGTSWIHFGGIVAPLVILTGVFIVTVGALSAFPGSPPGPEHPVLTDGGEPAFDPNVIRVTARQWWWDVRYGHPGSPEGFTTANEIHLPVGQPVWLQVTSGDVIHSFWIPQIHPKMDAVPGKTNAVVIRADSAGVYRGECAEYCGAQHAHMALVVVVEPMERYEAWLAQQRRPAREPATEAAAQGRDLFLSRGCSFCHAIRGTEALGSTVAPNLTHLASRRTIAAGTFPNNRAWLEAWIVDAPALKPGTKMPPMNNFSGRDLRALVTYLQTLR